MSRMFSASKSMEYINCLKVQYIKYYRLNLGHAFKSCPPPIKGFISNWHWIMSKSKIIKTRGSQRTTDVWNKDVPDMNTVFGKASLVHFNQTFVPSEKGLQANISVFNFIQTQANCELKRTLVCKLWRMLAADNLDNNFTVHLHFLSQISLSNNHLSRSQYVV